ncbi:alpha/beta hydrolase [Spongiivirga sp. MCCC 1A20706]|uniref:alpha/beta fold hydrolase n=1 Tax=Spongiivirga sp. MCCC 1A20706 TaxID=3160963 RepID=UPI0039779F75
MSKRDQFLILKDERKLGFAEYGKRGGFPIIYCHGSQSSRLEMHYDMSFALKNDLRIIIVDRPGHGISDFNPNGSILEFGNDIKQLVDHLKINRFSVAGMSAGAPFALGIAYLFPESVYKTSVISGFAPFNNESKKHLSNKVLQILNLAKSLPFFVKFLLKLQAKKIVHKPKKVLQGFLNIMSEPDQRIPKNESVRQVIESTFKEAFRNGSKGIAYEICNVLVQDWEFELDEIQAPITFWQGEKDTNVPFRWAELMANSFSNANLRKYPEEGHLLIFKYAQEIFTELKEVGTHTD